MIREKFVSRDLYRRRLKELARSNIRINEQKEEIIDLRKEKHDLLKEICDLKLKLREP